MPFKFGLLLLALMYITQHCKYGHITHRRKLYLQCTCCTILNAVDRSGSVFVYTGSDAVQFHDRMDSIQWVLLSILCNIKSRIVHFESQRKDEKNKGLQNHFSVGFWLYFKPEWTLHQHVFIALTGLKFLNMEHFLVCDFKKYRLLYVSCNVLSISRYET